MAYLYRPPVRTMTSVICGSLRYTYDVSLTVFQDANGVWQAQETPPFEVLAAALQTLPGGGRPQIIPDSLGVQLIAAGIGECIPIEP